MNIRSASYMNTLRAAERLNTPNDQIPQIVIPRSRVVNGKLLNTPVVIERHVVTSVKTNDSVSEKIVTVKDPLQPSIPASLLLRKHAQRKTCRASRSPFFGCENRTEEGPIPEEIPPVSEESSLLKLEEKIIPIESIQPFKIEEPCSTFEESTSVPRNRFGQVRPVDRVNRAVRVRNIPTPDIIDEPIAEALTPIEEPIVIPKIPSPSDLTPSVIRIPQLKSVSRGRHRSSGIVSASSRLSSKEEAVLENRGTDTHYYDGKLVTLLPELRDDLIRASWVTDPDKTRAFIDLENVLRERGGPHIANIMRSYMAIVTSHRKYGRMTLNNPNYDNDNNLFACDLLYLLYEKIVLESSQEHLKLLFEQLDDMASSLCEQGRTTRLFQALIMLRT